MLKTYTGSCHCGALRFEADLDLTQSTYRCNCSICRRTRFWPAVAKEGGFRAFGVGNDTPMGKMYGVNIGCLEGLSEQQLSELPITYVDGLHDWFAPPAFFSHL